MDGMTGEAVDASQNQRTRLQRNIHQATLGVVHRGGRETIILQIGTGGGVVTIHGNGQVMGGTGTI